MSKIIHAYYSPTIEERSGYVIYERANGERIKCTGVSSKSKESGDEFYIHNVKHKDTVYLGEVVKFISNHHHHSFLDDMIDWPDYEYDCQREDYEYDYDYERDWP